MKRLVLFVEGEGDERGAPVLVKRILTEQNAWQHVILDLNPFRVRDLGNLTGRKQDNWTRWLAAANKRPNLGAVLLLLDGDARPTAGQSFCAARVARELSQRARGVGAGSIFSVATVFACREYESWLIACAERLAGRPLPDGRLGLQPGTVAPAGDLEVTPRDAKGWLDQHMQSGYKPTRDQQPLTRLMVDHLDAIRRRQMRSFRRLENALQQLVNAVRSGSHIATTE